MDDYPKYSPASSTPPPMPPPYPGQVQFPPPHGGFGKAIATCFRKFATFSGRATRPEFWWWQLFQFIVNFAFSMVGGVLTAVLAFQAVSQDMEPDPLVMLIPQGFAWVVQLIFLLPNWAVACRRLHDTGHSGWWLALPLAIVPVMLAPIAGVGFFANGGSENMTAILVCAGLGVAALIATIAIGILVLVWFCSATQPGPNRYGPQPDPF